MRGLRAVALAAAVAVAAGCPGGPPQGRALLDEGFSGRGLGRGWATCHWWAPDGCTILTNDELEWYQRSQVSVRDGALRLTAEPGAVDAHGRHFPYVSGMVSSGPSVAFTYGRVEARFRVPRGAGLWPAIWMLPASQEALPEIDLVEVRGARPDLPAMTFHEADGGRRRREVRTADLSEGWHTVTLDWAPGRLAWAIDGTVHLVVTGDEVPDEPMYLVANLAVGGDGGRPTAATPFPATFLVDHLTVRALP